MLESMYITLTVIASVFLLCSFLDVKIISKIAMSSIAAILFAVLALSSAQVEALTCDKIALNSTTIANITTYVNDVKCATTNLFYEENGWIFWSMTAIATLISFAFTFVAIAKFKNLNAEDDI